MKYGRPLILSAGARFRLSGFAPYYLIVTMRTLMISAPAYIIATPHTLRRYFGQRSVSLAFRFRRWGAKWMQRAC